MIGKYLVDKGIITQKQLDEALAEQKKTGEFLGAILIEKRYASEHVIAKGLSEELGLAFMDLSKYSIEGAAIKLVPEALCRKYTLIPVYQAGHNLTVSMADPTDEEAKEEIKGITKLNVRPVFSPVSEIKERIDREYGGKEPAGKEPEAGFSYTPARRAAGARKEVDELIEVASLAPVIQVADALITKAVETRRNFYAVFLKLLRDLRSNQRGVRVDRKTKGKLLAIFQSTIFEHSLDHQPCEKRFAPTEIYLGYVLFVLS